MFCFPWVPLPSVQAYTRSRFEIEFWVMDQYRCWGHFTGMLMTSLRSRSLICSIVRHQRECHQSLKLSPTSLKSITALIKSLFLKEVLNHQIEMTTDVMKRNQSLTHERIHQVQDAVDQNKKSNENISKKLEVGLSSWSFSIGREFDICSAFYWPMIQTFLTSFLKLVKGRVADCVADFDSLKSTFETTSDKITVDMGHSRSGWLITTSHFCSKLGTCAN